MIKNLSFKGFITKDEIIINPQNVALSHILIEDVLSKNNLSINKSYVKFKYSNCKASFIGCNLESDNDWFVKRFDSDRIIDIIPSIKSIIPKAVSPYPTIIIFGNGRPRIITSKESTVLLYHFIPKSKLQNVKELFMNDKLYLLEDKESISMLALDIFNSFLKKEIYYKDALDKLSKLKTLKCTELDIQLIKVIEEEISNLLY